MRAVARREDDGDERPHRVPDWLMTRHVQFDCENEPARACLRRLGGRDKKAIHTPMRGVKPRIVFP